MKIASGEGVALAPGAGSGKLVSVSLSAMVTVALPGVPIAVGSVAGECHNHRLVSFHGGIVNRQPL